MQGFRPAWVYPLNMKTTRFIGLLLAAVLAAGCTHIEMPKESTSPKDGKHGANGTWTLKEEYDAIVTVKQADEKVYFQVDSVTRVYPAAGYYDSYKGPKRIACSLKVFDYQIYKDWWYTRVSWYENLDQGTLIRNPFASGINYRSFDVLDDWMTTMEDGFLTLHYSALWGSAKTPHGMSLVYGDDPWHWNLVHFTVGDDEAQTKVDALIYFDLNDAIPKTEGAAVTINWTALDGKPAQKTFWFRSRSE